MAEFIEFLREGLSNVVNTSLTNSIPLLNSDVNTNEIIIEIVATFVIQLLIFVLLFFYHLDYV